MDSNEKLIAAAGAVRENAYAPYSGFRVGAAVLDEQGNVHIGCNVENVAYPEGVCAEANAIGAMVAAGGTRVAAIAIIGGADDIEVCTPCGGCRQRIREFSDSDTRVILASGGETTESFSIEELLPASFDLEK
jgi:cytidine deaminase